MSKKKGKAATKAACLFLNKTVATANTAFFYAVIFYLMQVILFPGFISASGPAVFVEKAIGAQQMSIFISGARLPEMRKITFTCTYSIPHASIMDAIVSSPQPATAISVLVDTTTSSLSISINAASTILLPDNAHMVVLKMNSPPTGAAWPLMVVKALMIDKQNASVEVPVSINTSTIRYGGSAGNYAIKNDHVQTHWGEVALFDLSGRKISNSMRQIAPGCHLKTINTEYNSRIVSIR
jgi:hypothetical protein